MNNILNNKQWKAFHISCVFDIEGTITTHPSLLKEGGKTPRITCSSQNNGLDGCYYNAPTEYGNVLTVDSAADGYISYQQADFIATDHVEKLVFKKEHNYPFNKYLALFIKMCIDSAKKGKYSYGYKFAQRRINRQYIMLPVTPEGIPDWQFMEDYMKQIEHTLLQRYKNHIYLNINNIEKMGGGNFNLINWKAFYLTDVFSLAATQSSIDRINLNGKTGIHPYITRTDNTNGWDGFVDIQNGYHQDEGNVITIGLDTQTVFYQPIPFYTGQNIQILRHQKLNRYSALFVIPLIKMQMKKFNWGGNGATLGRLNKLRLILPTTQQDTPDWNFMENYMRYQELIMIRKFIDQRLNEIA